MRDLETVLRVDLFQRRGKRILLTSAGNIFQQHARAILRQIENFLEELSRAPGEMRGALHVGVVPILNVPLIPKLVGAFATTHPDVNLTVEEISSTEIETAIEEGRMDVGLGFLTRHSPNLHYEHLGDDQFALIVHRSHPWAKRRMISVTDLHRERIVQLPDSFVMRRMTDAICREHQVRPRTIAEINAIEPLLRSLAPLNAGALMPRIVVRENSELMAIRLKGKHLAAEIGILRLIDSGTNNMVADFTKLARATVPALIQHGMAGRR
jgi:LysR family cyn operon transcriptional activator